MVKKNRISEALDTIERAPAPKRAPRPRRAPKLGVVAVTGVSLPWGREVALELEAGSDFSRIIGIDTRADGAREHDPFAPRRRDTLARFRRTRFHAIGPRDPALVDLLREEKVEPVIHLDWIEAYWPVDDVFDRNVLGTMFLLSACANAGVRRVVMKSMTKAYGAFPDNPSFLTESMPLRAAPESPYIRDRLEAEKYAAEFADRRREVEVSLLRFPSILGPTCRTAFTDYLGTPYVPTVLGFDPLFQVIHEADVVAALIHSASSRVRGPVNITTDLVLPLSRVIALAGKTAVPCLTGTTWSAIGALRLLTGVPAPAIELQYLKYSWVAEARRMKDDLRFLPRHSGEETIAEFSERERMKRYT